ncbi:hypothetical protein ACI7RC_09980 [Brevibacillus sp. B_LB10_24]|uniref:hypothetical protein n=1 Tax=Brevibacillus sp. B_LB10_24 TaxID=3380645 RepID=UPI0038B95F49
MRQSFKGTVAQQMNNKGVSVDFHDFLERESAMSDVELSREFHLSMKDGRQLRGKMTR